MKLETLFAICLLLIAAHFATAQRDDPPPRTNVGATIDKALQDIKTIKADVAKLRQARCCCKH